MVSAQHLRQKMRLLDVPTFKSETKSINVQNLVMTITIGMMLINCVIIKVYTLDEFWVLMFAAVLYCFAMTICINYFLIIHNRTFKQARRVQLDS